MGRVMTMIQETPLLCYRGHGDVVNALCWSPDGRYIASASNDATIQIWDAKTGGRIQTYSGHNAPVEAVSWSPQGSLIASGGWDKLVHVWDMLSAKCVTSYRGHTAWIRKALA